jgi:colanic acid biosynthesis glycosyl transferase WcaI
MIYHVQDMQIEAAKDLGMIKSTLLINLLFRLEKFIFNKANYITSVSRKMVNRIEEKAGKQVHLFPNWTDLSLFYPISAKDELKQEFGLRATDRVVLYSGAIGEKQGLEAILRAAGEFRCQPEVKFIICGSGPYKQRLETLAGELQLTNVMFMALQPVERFNRLLNMAEVHLIIQKTTASDLVMPSKLTTILAVGGLALITADEGSGLAQLAQHYGLGLVIGSENQAALNHGLSRALGENHSEIKQNARRYAEEHLAIDQIMERFVTKILGGAPKATAAV